MKLRIGIFILLKLKINCFIQKGYKEITNTIESPRKEMNSRNIENGSAYNLRGNAKKRKISEVDDLEESIVPMKKPYGPKKEEPKKEEPKKDDSKKSKQDTIIVLDNEDDINELMRLLFPPTNRPPHGSSFEGPQFQPKHQKNDDVCKNPLCNHKTLEEDSTPVCIPDIKEIKTICDIITLGKSFHCKKNKEFAGMNLRAMFNLVAPLTELNNLVGMYNVKEHMVNQILFFLQGSHATGKCNKCTDCVFNLPCLNNQTEMLHTAITGPPGVGKTELGKILGKVYKEMGILSKGTFKLVTRADLIAGYLGQTALKTQKVIDEAKGGVLFIDEAYALGNSELRDSFSKECIDTLNQNLSEKRDFLCIIAGYEDELEKCFFKYNDGLRRRFSFRYDMTPYTYSELFSIFERKVHQINWKLFYDICDNDTDETRNNKNLLKNNVLELFKRNVSKFPNYGGDIETLLLNCKICHTRRCTFKEGEERKMLSMSDIEQGIKSFSSHRKYEKVKKQKREIANVNLNSKINVYSSNKMDVE